MGARDLICHGSAGRRGIMVLAACILVTAAVLAGVALVFYLAGYRAGAARISKIHVAACDKMPDEDDAAMMRYITLMQKGFDDGV